MYIAVFQSMNLVYKFKRYLAQKGEELELLHTPAGVSKGGCSFSLRFEEGKIGVVFAALKETGIENVEMFLEVVNGGIKSYEIFEIAGGDENHLS